MPAVYKAKKVESIAPASNSNNGGPLFTTLSSIMGHGPQPEHPADEGFFEVVTYSSRSSAASTVTNIKKGKRRIPTGRWVFTSKGDVETNTSVLYAKYLRTGGLTMQIKDMEHLLRELDRIGNINDDDFVVELSPMLSLTSGVQYGLSVSEAAEGHVLVGGGGRTPDECAKRAGVHIEEALDSWGYSY